MTAHRYAVGKLLRGSLLAMKPVLDKMFRPDSCIAQTRVAMDVLRRFGVNSYALPVEASFLNEKAEAFRVAGRPERAARQESGAYAVGIGVGPEKTDPAKTTELNRWNGHLILVVERSFILDLTADQASRPVRGLVVEAFFLPLPRGLIVGVPVKLSFPHEVTAWYRATPEKRMWKQSPDWEDRVRRAPVVDECEKALLVWLQEDKSHGN